MIYPKTYLHPIFWTWPHGGLEDQHYDLWPTEHPGQFRTFMIVRRDACCRTGVENGWYVGDRKVIIERVWLQPQSVDKRERWTELVFIRSTGRHALGPRGRATGG